MVEKQQKDLPIKKNPEHFHARDPIFYSLIPSLFTLYSAPDAPKVLDRVFGVWQLLRDR